MRSTRLAAAANSPMQRLMSSLVIACGTGQPVSKGMAEGASGVQPPSASLRIGLPPRRRRRGRAFASGMRKLDAQLGDAVSPTKVMDALERRLIVVRPHARAFRRNTAAWIDIGHLAHHESGAA